MPLFRADPDCSVPFRCPMSHDTVPMYEHTLTHTHNYSSDTFTNIWHVWFVIAEREKERDKKLTRGREISLSLSLYWEISLSPSLSLFLLCLSLTIFLSFMPLDTVPRCWSWMFRTVPVPLFRQQTHSNSNHSSCTVPLWVWLFRERQVERDKTLTRGGQGLNTQHGCVCLERSNGAQRSLRRLYFNIRIPFFHTINVIEIVLSCSLFLK